MNAISDAFVCWCCQRECFGDRVASGSILVCGPCDRLESPPPAPLLAAHSTPAEDAPTPSVTAEHSEPGQPHSGGGAGASLPSGWTRAYPVEANSPENYEHVSGATVWGPLASGGWSACTNGDGVRDASGPTMLQAMCAALGIELRPDRTGYEGYVVAVTTGDTMRALVSVYDRCADSESCARAALERFHALQQPAPAPEAPAPAFDHAAALEALKASRRAPPAALPLTPERAEALRVACLELAGAAGKVASQLRAALETHAGSPELDDWRRK